MKRFSFSCKWAGALVCLCAATQVCFGWNKLPERLRSPWDDVKVTLTDAPWTCPQAPEFAKTTNAEGYYVDAHYSVIDPVKKAAYEKADAGSVHLGQYAGQAADHYLATGSRAAAACVYSLLDAAAKADAWAGTMPHNQGVYDQNWMLSGTAIPYLKVRNSGVGTPEQDAEIQKWFMHVAAQVRSYFDEKHFHSNSDAWNNHEYWAGLAIASQGIANNDKDAFKWGMAAYSQGMDSIEPDGSLPAEMNRAGMALHYQIYALEPLVMLAELAEANGIDMYGQKKGAIHRLVNFDVAAMQDPAMIAKRTGVEQNVTLPFRGQDIGWAVPYVKRFPNAQLSEWIAKAPWTGSWQWGGMPPD
jgi:poly(beta-D-mannuronate) lyase